MGQSFTVSMSEWLFQQAFTCGMFWLHRHGDWFLIHLSCFEVDELQCKDGFHLLGFRLKPNDHWGRLVYWRLINGTTRRSESWSNRSLGVATVQIDG